MIHFQKSFGTAEIIGFSFLLFFFIYSVNFTFLPLFSSQLLVVGVTIIWGIQLLKNGKFEFSIDAGTQYILLLFGLLFLWTFFRTVESGFKDHNLLISIILLATQVFIGALFLSSWLFKKGYSLEGLVRFLQVVIVIQGIFVIIYFFSWEFKNFTLLFIPEGDNLPALHPFRSRGLTHEAGAKLASLQAVGLLFTGYLILKNRSWKVLGFDLISIGILLASVMLTGRSGFLILPILFLFFLTFIVLKVIIPKRLFFSGWIMPFIVMAGFFLFQYVFQISMGNEMDSGILRRLGQWAFGEFEDLATTGSSRTVDVLLTRHWFFPENASLLLFGDPNTYLVNRVHSDIGIIRRIFGIGIIGLILTYSFVVAVFYRMYKAASQLSDRLLILYLGLWIFILEFKEPFVTDVRFASVYLLLFCYLCLMPIQDLNRFTLQENLKN